MQTKQGVYDKEQYKVIDFKPKSRSWKHWSHTIYPLNFNKQNSQDIILNLDLSIHWPTMHVVQNQKFKTKQEIQNNFLRPESKTRNESIKKIKSDPKWHRKEKVIGISNSCEDATSLLSHGLLSNTHLCNIMREKLDKKLNNQNSDQNRIKILLDSLQNISESYPENSLLDFITEQLRTSIERT